MVHIQKIEPLTLAQLQPLLDASISEGYTFVQKLWDEYQSGVNDFSGDGEVLLGGYHDDQFVAIGGIHTDPYLNSPAIGRVRHVYVLPACRRYGIGKALVQALIDHSAAQFATVTLRTTTDHGRAFYTAIGFADAPRFADATHWLDVKAG